jgi:predicted metal-dependent hydrolase
VIVPALELSGQTVAYEVRRSTRARRARIVVHHWDGVEVVLPAAAPASTAERLVRNHGAWLLARLAERPAPPAPLADGSEIPWHGGTLRLRVRAGSGRARLTGHELAIAVADPADDDAIRAAVERVARAEARRLLTEEVAVAAAALGVQVAAISIRDARTRWGSCTSTGRLSFSWRLILAPPEVLRYVAVHEVCHLVERNHQPPFWALVDRLLPGWRAQRLWLRRHGPELRF